MHNWSDVLWGREVGGGYHIAQPDQANHGYNLTEINLKKQISSTSLMHHLWCSASKQKWKAAFQLCESDRNAIHMQKQKH